MRVKNLRRLGITFFLSLLTVAGCTVPENTEQPASQNTSSATSSDYLHTPEKQLGVSALGCDVYPLSAIDGDEPVNGLDVAGGFWVPGPCTDTQVLARFCDVDAAALTGDHLRPLPRTYNLSEDLELVIAQGEDGGVALICVNEYVGRVFTTPEWALLRAPTSPEAIELLNEPWMLPEPPHQLRQPK